MRSLQIFPHAFLFSLLLRAGLLGTGCASESQIASFDASAGRMEYETSEMRIISRISRSGYGNSSSITLRGQARCQGKNCTPKVAQLIFSVSGNSGVSFEDRTIQITADGESYEWRDQMGRRQGQALEEEGTAGQIGGVRLRLSQLKQIANASSVRGSIGGRSFELGEKEQAKLRAFLSAMRNPEEQADSRSQ